ncbi:MAG TPA: lytic murein transglycosylase [Roseiarcus sp.]|nr:lytic murein transglycosylase [Roseiarcus sp.]
MTTFAPLRRLASPMGWRWLFRLIAALLAMAIAAALALHPPPARAAAAAKPTDAAFHKFVADLWPLAKTRGVSRATFVTAFKGVTFDPKIVAHTKNQAEFVRPIWQYLASAVSSARVEHGRAKAEEERSWLAKAEATYGVDESVVIGIWGMETEFGAFEGSDNVIRALASLAFVRYRGDYFRDELIAALAILEEGDIGAREMRGSWAGAMGQTQFMPSSFNDYAVDFEGHGRRDIWNSAPDAIGSTANYLAKHGWIAGAPWGFEARLPAGFKLTDADSSRLAPFASFAERGVVRADGAPLPRSGEAQLLIPAGLDGPIFLVTANFKTIKSYNNSTAYALGVALLGDAIMGRGALRARWPVHDAGLGQREIRELQTRLRKLGYDVGDVDGRAGETLRAALRAYQESIGAPPDGYPTLALLRKMRARG